MKIVKTVKILFRVKVTIVIYVILLFAGVATIFSTDLSTTTAINVKSTYDGVNITSRCVQTALILLSAIGLAFFVNITTVQNV